MLSGYVAPCFLSVLQPFLAKIRCLWMLSRAVVEERCVLSCHCWEESLLCSVLLGRVCSAPDFPVRTSPGCIGKSEAAGIGAKVPDTKIICLVDCLFYA